MSSVLESELHLIYFCLAESC